MAEPTEAAKTLDQMWKNARDRARKETGMDIGQKSGGLDELLSKFDREYGSTDKNSTAKKVKQVVGEVLDVFQRMGDIASQAVSIVYAPASMCFNAVSFLIDSVKRIQKFHSDLLRVFDAIKYFLTEFGMLQRIERQYQALDNQNLPDEIAFNTNEIMCSFVNLCTCLYIAMNRNRWRRLASDLKVGLLDHDQGVKDEFENFKSLTERQNSIKVTSNLEEIKKSRQDLRQFSEQAALRHETNVRTNNVVMDIQGNMFNQRQEQEQRQRETRLAERFAIDKDKDDDRFYVKRQENSYQDLKQLRFDQTGRSQVGTWLEEYEPYALWRSGAEPTKPLLFVTGCKGSGKSVLTTRVIDDFLFDSSSGGRVAIGYYFFGNYRKRRNTNDRDLFILALCCMAFMLARQDFKYAKELDSSEDWKNDRDLQKLPLEDVWKALRLSAKSMTSFVLVLDGIDRLENHKEYITLINKMIGHQNHAETGGDPNSAGSTQRNGSLSEKVQSYPAIRVMISVRTMETVASLYGIESYCVHLGASSNENDVEPLNVRDLVQFIDRQMNREDSQIAQVKNPKFQTLRDRFREHLLHFSQGDFTLIASRIDKINQMISDGSKPDELESAMLSDKHDDQDALAKASLEVLELNFSRREISQINDILVWTVWSLGGDLTMEEIDAIATLNQSSANQWQTFSQQLKRKQAEYKELLEVYPDTASYDKKERIRIKPELSDYLHDMSWKGTEIEETDIQNSKSTPKISLSLKIEAEDHMAVQRFLWDLQEKYTFNRSFFDSKESEVNLNGIHVDQADSISRILIQCIEVLLTEREESTSEIIGHALHWLPQYIRKATQIEKEKESTTPQYRFPRKESIISDFVTLLCRESLPHHIRVYGILGLGRRWIIDEETTGAISTWLNLKTAQTLSSGPRNDLKRLLRNNNSPSGYVYNITHQIAEAWLCGELWSAKMAFDWVDDFLQAQYIYTSSEEPPAEGAGLDEKQEKDEQGQDESPERKPSSRQSTTLVDRITQAAAWTQKLLNITERNGLFLERLGLTYLAYGKRESIETLHKALEITKDSQRVHSHLSQCHKQFKEWHKAIDHGEKALQLLSENVDNRRDGQSEEGLIKSLPEERRSLSECYDEVGQSEKAVALLMQSIEQDQYDYSSYQALVTVVHKNQMNERGQMTIEKLRAMPPKDTFKSLPLTGLSEFCLSPKSSDEVLDKLVSLAYRIGCLEIVGQAFETAADYMEVTDPEDIISRVSLLRHASDCVCLRGEGNDSFVSATEILASCLSMFDPEDRSEGSIRARNQIGERIAIYLFTFVQSGVDVGKHISEIEELTEASKSSKAILAYSCATTGRNDKARSLCKRIVQKSIELLSDDDPDNDWIGYSALLKASGFINDLANAMASASLVAPDVDEYDRQMREYNAANEATANANANDIPSEVPSTTDNTGDSPEAKSADLANGTTADATSSEPSPIAEKPVLKGPSTITCDGVCGRVWTYVDDHWSCAVCANIGFCTSCYDKLQAGCLEKVVCHKNHTFFHNPPWSREEYEKVGKGRVRIPKQVSENEWSWEEGEIMEISTWLLDRICADWGIEKPAVIAQGQLGSRPVSPKPE